jgi:DNA polymerase-3 subunit alpha
MYFGNFVDVKGEHIDTVHFPPAAKKYPFKGRGVYELTGKVTEEFDCITVEIEKMEKLAIIQDPRYADIPKKLQV